MPKRSDRQEVPVAETETPQLCSQAMVIANLSDSMKLLTVTNSARRSVRPPSELFNSHVVREDCYNSCELQRRLNNDHVLSDSNEVEWCRKRLQYSGEDTAKHPRIVFNPNLRERHWMASCARDVYAQDDDGDTDLHVAIMQHQQQLATLFVSLAPHPDWLDIPNRLLQTPLHVAVIMRDVAVVRKLVVSGSRPDARDIHGNTPLHIACREGYRNIVSCLLQETSHSDPVGNNNDRTYQRTPQALELSNYDGCNCLYLAAKESHIDVLDVLLTHGADVNAREHKSGRTVVHHAAETNKCRLLNFLLQKPEVEVDAETYGGLTALRLAVGRGHLEVVQALLVKGAYQDPDNGDDGQQDEPLYYVEST